MNKQQEIFENARVLVLVPTYNNATKLAEVLKDILSYTHHVLVVNDGSTDETLSVLSQFSQIKLATYPTNKGKGYALQIGFKKAIEMGYDYVISLDSDGQHFAKNLLQFKETIELQPQHLIVGVRNMNQESVPVKSNFGRRFSNFWFMVETGINLKDTQSGFRLYPLKSLEQIRFYTKRFEFEIEVLVRASWRGISILEIPIEVYYPSTDERISHFRPLKDFTRISILNCVLVPIAILWLRPLKFFRSNFKRSIKETLSHLINDPAQSNICKAKSIGFGVFMGILPIWGFQLAVGIPLSFLFKLNKPLFILAAHISIPPTIPIILYLSHKTGKLWIGNAGHSLVFNSDLSMSQIQNSLMQYILGSCTLAIVSGVFVFFVALGFMRIKRNKVTA